MKKEMLQIVANNLLNFVPSFFNTPCEKYNNDLTRSVLQVIYPCPTAWITTLKSAAIHLTTIIINKIIFQQNIQPDLQ